MKKIIVYLTLSLMCIATIAYAEEGEYVLHGLKHTGETDLIIHWPTDKPAIPHVKYGLDESNLDMVSEPGVSRPFIDGDGSISHYTHEVILRNLLPDKEYHYRMATHFEDGRIVESQLLQFSTDLTPPVVEIISPFQDDVLTGAVTLELTATDNVGVSLAGFNIKCDGDATLNVEPFSGPGTLKVGVYDGNSYTLEDNFCAVIDMPLGSELVFESLPYRALWDTTQFKDGEYIISAWAWGGPVTYKKIRVRVDNIPPDTTPPTARITYPEDGATIYGKVKMTAEAADNHEVSTVKYFANEQYEGYGRGPLYEREWNTAFDEPGVYQLQAKVWDVSRNEGTSEIITVTVIEKVEDTTPPETTDNYEYSEVWINTDAYITLTAIDDISGVAKTCYTIGGVQYEGTAISLTNEGEHLVYYWSVDNGGNIEGEKVITVKIDKTPPQTTDNYQYDGIWINEDANITLTAIDDISGVAKTYYTINDVEYEGTAISLTNEGEYVVNYWSVDNSGNIEGAKVITVKIDKTPPEVAISVDPSILWPVNQVVEITINGSAVDNLSGISSKEFTVVDEYEEVEANPSEFGDKIEVISWRTGSDIEGRTYTVSVVVTDKAGNSTTKETVAIVPHDMR